MRTSSLSNHFSRNYVDDMKREFYTHWDKDSYGAFFINVFVFVLLILLLLSLVIISILLLLILMVCLIYLLWVKREEGTPTIALPVLLVVDDGSEDGVVLRLVDVLLLLLLVEVTCGFSLRRALLNLTSKLFSCMCIKIFTNQSWCTSAAALDRFVGTIAKQHLKKFIQCYEIGSYNITTGPAYGLNGSGG